MRLMMHAVKLPEEAWLDWHVQTLRRAKSQLEQVWGAPPATIILASAAAAVKCLASRPAYSIVGRTLRWKSSADVEALRETVGSALKAWARWMWGRPRLRWEAPWVALRSSQWRTGVDDVEESKPHAFAREVTADRQTY